MSHDTAKGPRGMRRGRGARERLLGAAAQCFRADGINRTGMDQLCATAHVSKRTAYQHFSSKEELVAAYLQTQVLEVLPGEFFRPDLSPRDQLLAVFVPAGRGTPSLCPFVGAAVETADPHSPVRALARDYKRSVADRLTVIARAAGATSPVELGEQLALLLDGASVRTHVVGVDTMPAAAAVARMLVDASLPNAS